MFYPRPGHGPKPTLQHPFSVASTYTWRLCIATSNLVVVGRLLNTHKYLYIGSRLTFVLLVN